VLDEKVCPHFFCMPVKCLYMLLGLSHTQNTKNKDMSYLRSAGLPVILCQRGRCNVHSTDLTLN